MKVEELYQTEIVHQLRKNDEEYADLIQNWKNSDVYTEILDLIDEAGLQEFQYETLGGQSLLNVNEISSELRQNNINSIKEWSKSEPEPEIPKPEIEELPKLTSTERRTSLDLMYSKMNGPISAPDSLSRAASVSTSNVNVITKAEVTGLTRIDNKVPIKNSLRSVLKKLAGFNLGKKTKELTTKPSPASIDRTRHTSTPPRVNGLAEKKNRRISLVGENLPMYIRQQLKLPDNEEEGSDSGSGRIKSPESDSINSLSKKPSRINNLLANSQSLYSHSKDVSSQNHTSNTSLYDNDTTSDNDKEYILPNLFTKYYGEDDEDSNVDAIIKGIEDLGEDAEFVNLGGSYEYFEDDVEEEEEEEEGGNDYLFR